MTSSPRGLQYMFHRNSGLCTMKEIRGAIVAQYGARYSPVIDLRVRRQSILHLRGSRS